MPQPAIAQTPDWVISDDKVFIDDENVYLSATPHTLSGSGWVEFELLSKKYEGEIDAVWGFSFIEGVIPSKPQIWAEDVPHTKYRLVDVEKEDTLFVTGITSFTKLYWSSFEGEPDIGNRNNTYLYEVTADFWDFWDTEESMTLVVAFNAYTLDGDIATITYNYDTKESEAYIEYYDDWKPFDTSNFTGAFRYYKGCNEWHFTKLDAPIQKNITYKVRCWVEVPFKGRETVSGKYIWAVKPSGETFQEAVDNGHLYVLDPWYNASWPYRLEITIDHTKVDANLVDFPVLITEANMTAQFWANVKADGTDIVVTDDDGETKLKRELVDINTVGETMELWFKAPTLSSTVDDVFYLYFGNAGAAEVNDTATWDTNYVFVSHMEDDPDNAHIVDSTSHGDDGTKLAANEPIEVVGQIGRAQDFDGDNDLIDMGNEAGLVDGALTIEAVITRSSDLLVDDHDDIVSHKHDWSGAHFNYRFWLFVNDSLATARLALYYGTGTTRAAATSNYQAWNVDQKYNVAVVHDGETVSFYRDGANVVSVGGQSAIVSLNDYSLRIGCQANQNIKNWLGIIDEVRISATDRSVGWVGTTHNTTSSPATFYSVSGEALVLPTVETDNADVDGTSSTLNGEITDTGYPYPDDERGFVWDTATHADPGNTAPIISAYSDYWTESGSFGTGTFDYEATGLTALVTYYYRACAHNPTGWAYGEEITFFALPDGKVYLEFRPDLDETRIRGNAGIPSDVRIGEPGEGLYVGYSLPIYNEDDEELYFTHCVPDRWDSDSDPVYGSHILVHIDSSLANANESGNSYTLQLEWEHVTPNEEEVPVTLHTTTVTRTIYSDTQFEFYQDWLVILYNADFPDNVASDDLLSLRIRRISAGGQLKDLDGELIIQAMDVLYARGDLLGDVEGGILVLINTWIEEGLLIGGESMVFFALIVLALAFTITSYIFKRGMLAFAGAGAWIITAIYCFIESTEAWDVYFSLAFLFIGLTIACFFAPLAWKETTMSGDRTEDPDLAAMREEMETFNKERNQYSFLHSKQPRRRRRW